MRQLGEKHLADIRQLVESYLSSREQLEPISCEELMRVYRRTTGSRL